MTPDTLTPLIRRLNESTLGLAAIGAALRLRDGGAQADPAIAAALREVAGALGARPVAGLTEEDARQALGLIRTFFIEAKDLLDDPARPAGWTFDDPAILQGIGASSAGLVTRMTVLGLSRPWLAELLSGTGVFLDVGTGVGGIALAAALAWPTMAIEGIDVWQPSLDLALQNRAASPGGARVAFHNRSLSEVAAPESYSVIWVPTPFIAGGVVADAIPRLLGALAPGGVLIVGVLPLPEAPLGAALGRLRTLRNGGHPWSCAEMAMLLEDAGFSDVEVPANQAGMHFILGRR